MGVGAGGISCQMCNKISLAGGQTLPLKRVFMESLFEKKNARANFSFNAS